MLAATRDGSLPDGGSSRDGLARARRGIGFTSAKVQKNTTAADATATSTGKRTCQWPSGRSFNDCPSIAVLTGDVGGHDEQRHPAIADIVSAIVLRARHAKPNAAMPGAGVRVHRLTTQEGRSGGRRKAFA